MFSHVLNWFLHPTCILCGAPSRRSIDLCQPCERDLPYIEKGCEQCAQPFMGGESKICGTCLKDPPAYNRLLALCYYQWPVTYLIAGLKFQNKLSYARLLSSLLIERLKETYQPLPDVMIPVPLHLKRLRERGYNQALELAKPLAKVLKIPLETHSCKRIRATEAQTQIPAKERANNMKQAFQIDAAFQAKHVVLIDDVVTTGSTVAELSRMLRHAGVKQIDVVCCARTTKDV